jgi:hypothetical protein
MIQHNGQEQLSEDQRKEVFFSLVNAQDQKVGVVESRRLIAQRFGVSESLVRQIEREGIDSQWPPL